MKTFKNLQTFEQHSNKNDKYITTSYSKITPEWIY